MKFFVLQIALVSASLFTIGCGSSNSLPPAVDQALSDSSSFVLLSLNPDPRAAPTEGKRIHQWNVLGEAVVNDPSTRYKLIAALRAGVAENNGEVADCFNPRHGIRVTDDGKIHELVVCFECYQIRWYADGEMVKTTLVTGSPQSTFDQVLKDADIPLAEKL